MNLRKKILAAAAIVATASIFSAPANAAIVFCGNPFTNNSMQMLDITADSCVDTGQGNINGNPATDAFLLGDSAGTFEHIGDGSYTQLLQTKYLSGGTFWFDSDLWDSWDEIAIGFKFGTGNRGDNWFVFLLNDFVSSGFWSFTNYYGKGGGLSHVELYGSGYSVPEPGTLALLGAALLGVGLARRRRVTN